MKQKDVTETKIQNQDIDEIANDQALRSALDLFNQSSHRLAAAYSELKKKVEAIDKEMEAKNLELNNKVNELHRITRYMDSILESMHSGVIAVDMDGRVTTINRAAQDILNVKKDDVIGKQPEAVMSSPDDKTSLLRKALEVKQEFPNVKREIQRLDDKTIWVESSVALLRGGDEGVIGAVEVFKDLSEIKLLKDRLEQAGELASIGEMTASIAHEIRNPLNGIRGFAALLEKDFKWDDRRKRFAKRIIDGVENLESMVTDFLILAKPIKPVLKKNDLVDIISEVVAFAREDLRELRHGIKIETDYDKEPTVLACDRYLLYQAFYNLVQNSCQAIPGDGIISIGINRGHSACHRSGNGKVEVSISDTGIGINKECISRIFEPFFTTKPGGTGLGLSLVQKIIRLHNGEIGLESSPGRGTTFRVYLPGMNGVS